MYFTGRQVADQVGDKDEAPLEERDGEEIAGSVVAGEVIGKGLDPMLDLVGGE